MRRYLIALIDSLANISLLSSQPFKLLALQRRIPPSTVKLESDGVAILKVNAALQCQDYFPVVRPNRLCRLAALWWAMPCA
jgi:hypothetical protein